MKHLAAFIALFLSINCIFAIAEEPSVIDEEWGEYVGALLPIADRMAVHLTDAEDERQRHELYEFLFSQVSAAYTMLFYTDPEYPDFWPIFSHVNDILWGNPDTVYHVTPVDHDGVYRLSGSRGTVRIVDVQVGGGEFVTRGAAGGMGPAISNYDLNDLTIGSDGLFDVIISAKRPEGYTGDWWQLDPKGTYILTRKVAYDWMNEEDPKITIDRLDKPVMRPRATSEQLRENLKQLSVWTENWVNLSYKVASRARSRGLVDKFDFVDWAASGFGTQRYVVSAFDLEEDEALLIETEVPDECRYWSFQLVSESWRAISPIHHQSSLNAHQAQLDSDGKFRAVVSLNDPGVPNWLDPAGYNSARVYGRWNGCSSAPLPVATKIKLADVRKYLPSDTAHVSAERRDESLRLRRKGAQLRRRW